MRLIDADDLINNLVNACNNDHSKFLPTWIEKQIDTQQTHRVDDPPKRADMVCVVRCKDCRWGDWTKNMKGDEMLFCYNGNTGIEDGYLHEPEWFCAEGERREE